ncbi:MAG: glycosyltransferase family A protein [Vicinamibacterales bacterium]
MSGRDRALNAQPLVSIVVLNYNYGRYLTEAVESALSQTYPAIEVVVVDDGSTDESAEVLARYEGRVTICRKRNGGMVSAMNRGFAESRGDVIVFLDADDFLLPDAVAVHVAALADPGVVRSRDLT